MSTVFNGFFETFLGTIRKKTECVARKEEPKTSIPGKP